MRKFITFGCFLLLLVALAVPAFAMGASSSSDSDVFSVLPFDNISWYGSNAYYSGAFPFNSGVEGGIVNFDYFDSDGYPEFFGYQGTAYENGQYVITGDMSFADFSGSPSFRLSSFNKYIYVPSFVDKFIISVNPNDIKIDSTELYVEYYVKRLSASGDRWIIEKESFSHIESYYPSGIVDVSYQFESLARAVGSNDIFVAYMDFQVNYHRLTVSTPSFDVQIPAVDDMPGYDPVYWFLDQDLSVEHITAPSLEDTDIFKWLTDSVNAFLDVEFFPGFSVNRLFVIVITIGLMLWFITLLI